MWLMMMMMMTTMLKTSILFVPFLMNAATAYDATWESLDKRPLPQ
jgi:uncharacterized membrane protein